MWELLLIITFNLSIANKGTWLYPSVIPPHVTTSYLCYHSHTFEADQITQANIQLYSSLLSILIDKNVLNSFLVTELTIHFHTWTSFQHLALLYFQIVIKCSRAQLSLALPHVDSLSAGNSLQAHPSMWRWIFLSPDQGQGFFCLRMLKWFSVALEMNKLGPRSD